MTAYTKIYNVDGTGQTLNKRTLAIFEQIKQVYDVLGGTGHLILVQGSYTSGVDASKGTHDGGGALDIVPSVKTKKNFNILQKAARFCQVAAWHRVPSQGQWSDHVHGIVIGDKQVAPLAASQIRDYYAHRSGLVGHVADSTWHPSVIFSPRYPLRHVNLKNVRQEAKKAYNWIPRRGVIRIQKALNKKLGTNLRVDGIYGKKTRKAFASWEHIVGGNGDGIPGKYALVLLCAGMFKVITT